MNHPSTVFCPVCGKPLRVIEMMRNSMYYERDTFISVCGCGVFDVVICEGKITAVTLRDTRKRSLSQAYTG